MGILLDFWAAKIHPAAVWSFLCSCLLAIAPSPTLADWYYEEDQIFGTNVSIQLWADTDKQAASVLADSFAIMWEIHNQLSPYIEESELSRLNRTAHPGPVEVSNELATLLDKSIFYGNQSRGAFDITFASLGYLYDYREEKQPTDEEIERLKTVINYRLIEFNREANQVRFLNPLVKIDLGGIAKGYAIERVKNFLRERGIQDATITAGGDSVMLGDKRGEHWVVGIRNPRAEETAIRLPLDDIAISTSGDYERFFIDADTGDRIHHILNPLTGTSATGIASVSVIGPSAFDTDPLSTTLFVLGVEKGMQLIEESPGFDAVFIDLNGKVHFSSGLQSPQ